MQNSSRAWLLEKSKKVKFKDSFEHKSLSKVPSHRALAMLRGRNEGFLTLTLNADPELEETARQSHCETIVGTLRHSFSQAPADMAQASH